MKCPLLKIARAGLISEAARPLDDCMEKECAWWDEEFKRCAVLVLAKERTRIIYKGAKR